MLVIFAKGVYSQEEVTPKLPAVAPKIQIPPQPKVLISPNDEVEDAIVFLRDGLTNPDDAEYIRFFTTYAVPEANRDKVVLTLSFVVHSLAGLSPNPDETSGGYAPLAKNISEKDGEYSIIPIHRVPNSKTLWWIDLRDYNWTREAWEAVAELDGYFVSPVIDYDSYSALKLLSGNAILRADWFIMHATDMSVQVDHDRKTLIYDTLLYAKQKSIPKHIDEWRKIWGVDIELAQSLGADYATLVSKSKVVSRNGTRILFGYRTPLGYYYDTYDVKNIEGFRDYVDNIIKFRGRPPNISDGGETFGTNHLGLQVYALRDAKGNLVPFADATIVRHLTDQLGDARVITGRSCMDCHSAGPIPAENTYKEFIEAQNKSYAYDKYDALRIKRVFLSNKFEDAVIENQELFAKGLKKCNGLTPEQNNKLFLEAIYKYGAAVDVDQAAFECGITTEEFKAQLKGKNISLRLSKLVSNNTEAIPRQAWETPGADGNPGLFQQAMIAINGLTAKIEETRIVDKSSVRIYGTVKVNSQAKISDAKTRIERVVANVKVGDKLEIFDVRKDEWIGVLINGEKAYLKKTELVRDE